MGRDGDDLGRLGVADGLELHAAADARAALFYHGCTGRIHICGKFHLLESIFILWGKRIIPTNVKEFVKLGFVSTTSHPLLFHFEVRVFLVFLLKLFSRLKASSECIAGFLLRVWPS